MSFLTTDQLVHGSAGLLMGPNLDLQLQENIELVRR